MESIAEVISQLTDPNSEQANQAEMHIRELMNTKPRDFLIELKAICHESSADEKVVAQAAVLINNRFWK